MYRFQSSVISFVKQLRTLLFELFEFCPAKYKSNERVGLWSKRVPVFCGAHVRILPIIV